MSQNSDSHRVVIRRNLRLEISESTMAINKNMTRELQEDYRNLDLHKDFEDLLHQDEQQK